MLSSNYTLTDLARSLCALVLFTPFLLVPGYVAGWLSDCFAFRTLSFRSRQLVSIPLSMALSPIVIYWAGTVVSWTVVALLFALLFAFWIFLLSGAWGHERPSEWFTSLRATPYQAWLIAAIWVAIALLSLVDLQFGDRLYFSVTVYDHSVRTAITEAITRTGPRPDNPFYFLSGPTPLRYHYFWFLPSGLLNAVTGGHIGARNFINASVVWCGWGLLSIVVLALRALYGLKGAALKRRSFIAIGLFTVTGLDLLPTLYLLRHHHVYPEMEWWNDPQVTSWFGSVLWVPHHTAGLVVGIIAFLLCWDAALRLTLSERISCAVLAGIALATLVGTSVYVAVVIAAFFVLWTAWMLLRRDRKQLMVLVIAGIIALTIVVPYLRTLTGPGEGGPFLSLSLRHFWVADNYVADHGLYGTAGLLFRLALVPLNLFLELGFFFVAGLAYLYRFRKSGTLNMPGATLLLLAGTALCICIFVRSGVIYANDLGMRGFLPVQFVLLLWSAELVDVWLTNRRSSARKRLPWMMAGAWAMLLLIGLGGTLYELTMSRFNAVLADAGILPVFFGPDRQLGKRTLALRRAYEILDRELPDSAVVQNNPEWTYTDFYYGLYADRQTAAYDKTCGSQFGGDPHLCAKDYPELLSVFTTPNQLGSKDIQQLCHRLGITALVIKDLDGAWQANPSWAAQWKPLVSNNYARILLVPQSSALVSKAVPKRD